mgnify:CR=1 FL=1
MKKCMTLLLAGLLLLAALTACGKAPAVSEPDFSEVSEVSVPVSTDESSEPAEPETTTTTAGSNTTAKPTTTKLVSKAPTAKTPTTEAPTTTAPKKPEVRITTIAGPTGVGMAQLMAQNDAQKTANAYTFDVVDDPTKAVAAVSNGSTDIAAVPTNLAATLYKKTSGKVQILAVNTLGVLYMLDNGAGIKAVADLKGKEIYSSGQGANPEYVLRYILEKNGLNPDKDVKLHFVEDNDALTAAIVQGAAQVAMVPEPKVTVCLVQMKAAGKTVPTVALNMTEEWNKVAGGSSTLMMGCVIARKEFVEKNGAAVQAFLKEYESSITAVKSDVEAAAGWCETYKIIPKAAIAKQAIPRCGLTFVTGAAMKQQLSGYLDVLFKANPKVVGGSMPADNFYYGS